MIKVAKFVLDNKTINVRHATMVGIYYQLLVQIVLRNALHVPALLFVLVVFQDNFCKDKHVLSVIKLVKHVKLKELQIVKHVLKVFI